MSKKATKVAVTYIVTILLTLVAVGGVCIYMYFSLFSKEEDDKTTKVNIEQMIEQNEYEPSSKDNRTLLIIYDSEKRESASCFLIARFLAVEKQVVFIPIPSNTIAEVNGQTDTVYNFYRNGSTASAVSAVRECTGAPIDKYIRLNNSSFPVIADILGGIDFDIPYNLVYTNPSTGEETVLKAGKTYIDSNTLRKIITYPNYTSGEEYRAKCLGVAVTDMFNSNVTSNFASHLDDYFSAVINSDIETNITSYDYKESSAAMKYVIENTDKLAMFVPSSGITDENGHYELDANFVKSLNEWLKLYENQTDVSFPEETTVSTNNTD